MVNRQTTPVLGAKLSPYLEPGEWQIGATYRTFRADKQFQATRLNPVVTRLKTQVISKLQTLELNGTYSIDRQWNLSLGVPIQLYGSSSRALPANAAGSPRFVQSAKGIGDMTLSARRWLLDCEKHADQNVALGIGIKFPTGNPDARDRFPNAAGANPALRVVDPSIQPGDSGWGVVVDVQAFKNIGSATVFLSGAYLFNPKDENDTFSPPAFLNPAGPGAVARDQRFNTVGDQYIGRVGVAHPVPGIRGLSALLAGRVEGVPIEDVFGDTIGFRRPGYSIAIEPGLIYSTGRTSFTLSVPVRTHQNVQASLGRLRDSTFADFVIIAGITHRFGR